MARVADCKHEQLSCIDACNDAKFEAITSAHELLLSVHSMQVNCDVFTINITSHQFAMDLIGQVIPYRLYPFTNISALPHLHMLIHV